MVERSSLELKLLIHISIGFVIFLIAGFIQEFRLTSLAVVIAIAAFCYTVMNVGLIIYNDVIPSLNRRAREKENKYAHEQLLRFKKLLDEGILTQEEFDIKAQEFKRKIL